MISYMPLWKTMEEKGATTYTLQVKGGISSSTIRRMKADQSVSTNTLDALCNVLECSLHDVAEHIPDQDQP
jgi:DNA-binding Xre family transcriptional regulator